MFNIFNIFNANENELDPYDEQQITQDFQDYVDSLPAYYVTDANSAIYDFTIVNDFTRELNLNNVGGQFTVSQIQKILQRNNYLLH